MNLINMDTAGNIYYIHYNGEGTSVSSEFMYNIHDIPKPMVICNGRGCSQIQE